MTHEVQDSGSSFDACFTQSKAVEGILSDMSSKLLPNGAPFDHPLPSIGELNNQCQDRHTSEENAYSNAISSAISTSDTSFVKGNTESRVSSSSTLTEMVPPKCSHSASKFAPYGNLVAGSGIGDSQYSQPDQGLEVISKGLDTLKNMAHDLNEVNNAASDLKNTNVRLNDTVNQRLRGLKAMGSSMESDSE
ncbi:Syntaxin-71 [Camellia lanceoleosa]|uniref:Syntaxin-71 n=1 Tax=Camellia lanceoleosa TaxID=1840588 RepID=A0ACC0H7G2_9ERIC|nr:Syntaxin-71 [Camellia lanceoleosa]